MSAVDTQRAAQIGHIDRELMVFSRWWRLDGDYIRCIACKRPCLASYAHMRFDHAAGCRNAATAVERPWLALRHILAAFDKVDETAEAAGNGGGDV